MDIIIYCPRDMSALDFDSSTAAYFCSVCSAQFPLDRGVIRLTNSENGFYEGCFENRVHYIPRNEKLIFRWPLWLINSGFIWEVRKYLPAGSTVLELGCAGGVDYFGKRYKMVGVDLSFSSLVNAAKSYTYAVHGDASRLPLPDCSVNGVISSFFWEHIPKDEKRVFLAEFNRVLRPEGKLIFLFDVKNANPLIRYYQKTDPDLYDKLFLEKDGHVGFHTWDENLKMLRDSAFHVTRITGHERTFLLSPSVFKKLRQWKGLMGSTVFPMTIFSSYPWYYGYVAAVRIIDTTVGRLLPLSWARTVCVVCTKESRRI